MSFVLTNFKKMKDVFDELFESCKFVSSHFFASVQYYNDVIVSWASCFTKSKYGQVINLHVRVKRI